MIGDLVYYAKSAAFVASKHITGFHVSTTPSFDASGLEFFNQIVPHSKHYLEYGSGGSTVVAARSVKMLVSVESDPVFAKAVRRALSDSDADIHLLNPNIGITRHWGFPVVGIPTPARVERWKSYPKAPWGIFTSRGVKPDTILIDGRFRVACMLESLLHVDASTRIMFDDYDDPARDYRIVEQFADLVALHGRMGEFRKSDRFNSDACRRRLASAYAMLD